MYCKYKCAAMVIAKAIKSGKTAFISDASGIVGHAASVTRHG